VWVDLGGPFAQSLVLDFPTGELDVTAQHLEAWGLDFQDLMVQARSNLLARGAEEGFLRSRSGYWRSTWEDALDGSRVLLPGVLRRLPVQGDPVALMPRKDVLLVTGTEDEDILARAIAFARDLMDGSSDTLDPSPIRLRGFLWEPHPAISESRPPQRFSPGACA
jgi:hypothetical protein